MNRALYLLRRWWWRNVRSPVAGRCMDCGAQLTPAEAKYYEHTCDRCEGELMRLWDDL